MHPCCLFTPDPFSLCMPTRLHPCLLFCLCLLAVCFGDAVSHECVFAKLMQSSFKAHPTLRAHCAQMLSNMASQADPHSNLCKATAPQDVEDPPADAAQSLSL